MNTSERDKELRIVQVLVGTTTITEETTSVRTEWKETTTDISEVIQTLLNAPIKGTRGSGASLYGHAKFKN
jgi:hypothetical protein